MQKFKESFRANTPIEIGQLQPALRSASAGRRKRRSRSRGRSSQRLWPGCLPAVPRFLRCREELCPLPPASLCSQNPRHCPPDKSSELRPWSERTCVPGWKANLSEPQPPHLRTGMNCPPSREVEKVSNNLWKVPSTGPGYSRCSSSCSWCHFGECEKARMFLWKTSSDWDHSTAFGPTL